jgi:hypothetical protein
MLQLLIRCSVSKFENEYQNETKRREAERGALEIEKVQAPVMAIIIPSQELLEVHSELFLDMFESSIERSA